MHVNWLYLTSMIARSYGPGIFHPLVMDLCD